MLRILRSEDLVTASREKGERLQALLRVRLGEDDHVGEIRGRGLLVGLELVESGDTRAPFDRAAHLTEAVVRAARDRGVLVYSGTGTANGTDGDTILLGPPFVVTDEELIRIADVLAEAIPAAVASIASAAQTS